MMTRLLRMFILLGFGLIGSCAPRVHGMGTPLLPVVNPTDPVAKFVHEQIGKAGVKNPDAVLVLDSPQGYEASLWAILVPKKELSTILKEKSCRKLDTDEDVAHLIVDAINKRKVLNVYSEALPLRGCSSAEIRERLAKELEQRYQESRGALAHEAHHYINQDVNKINEFNRNLSMADRAMESTALVTCPLFFAAEGKKEQDFLAMACLSTLFARVLVSPLAKPLLSNAYSRELEWQADENIPDDAKILRARQEQYKRYDRDARERLRQGFRHEKDMFNTSLVHNLAESEHPTLRARSQRFKERADAVEQGKPRPPRSRFGFCAVS